MKLEHMQMRWKALIGAEWVEIWTVNDERCVACVHCDFSGDLTGELTARAICDEHNKALEGKK